MTARKKKWLFRAAKLAMLAVILWAVHRTLFDAWTQLTEKSPDGPHWQVRIEWLVLAAGVYLVGLLPAGIFWHRVLRSLGQEAGLGETLRAYYIGHLGKYVPGKAMVVILRTGLIRSHRVDTAVAAVSVFLETLTWIACGGFLAAIYLAIHFRGQSLPMWGAIGLAVGVGVPTFPPVFRWLVRVAKFEKLNPLAARQLEQLSHKTLLFGWMLSTFVWALLGVSYWAVLEGMGISGLDPLADLPRYTASVALATLAGFVVLLIPGGLGVREAALAELMAPYLEGLVPKAALIAIASAALLRVVWLLSELAISGILYVVGPRAPLASRGASDA
ncbi:MAG: flippase-like domain-containing protein [Thermoguttaceae bacterium]|jgi:uncharacterized membrane protein YbhN (UPF0104 family)|nr:flippase-like domain-containing protein [Thermoguttaceae bacterium]